MTIAFPCESCGHRFQVDSGLAGKKVRCKHCGHVFVVPVPRQSSRPARAAQPEPVELARPVAPRPKPAANPYLNPGPDDPYGWDDAPPPPRKPASDFQDDFAPLPSRAPRGAAPSKKKRRRSSDEQWYELAPWLIFKYGSFVCLGLLPFAFFLPRFFGVGLILAAGLVSFSLIMIGSVGQLIVPFQEDVLCGLMNMFLPIYPLYYLLTRWEAMKRWFLSSLGGVAYMFVFFGAILATGIIPLGETPNGVGQVTVVGSVRRAGVGVGASELEREWVGKIELIESLADLLGTINDEEAAANAAPTFRDKQQELARISPRLEQDKAEASFVDRVAVETRCLSRDERASRRYKSEFERCRAIPPLWMALNAILPLGGPPIARAEPPDRFGGRGGLGPPIKREPPTQRDLGPGNDVPDPAPIQNRPGRKEVVRSLEEIVDDLKVPDNFARKRALEQLMRTKVDPDRREEVAGAIADILTDPDVWTRKDAAKALAYWGTSKNIPAMIAALRDDDHFFKEELLSAFAAIKDPSGAEEVAACLPKNKERAAKALIAMGSEAEPAVMKYLTHTDVFVRTEACKVLEQIGTKKSIPALQALYKRANGFGFDADAAKAAAQRIDPSMGSSKKSRR